MLRDSQIEDYIEQVEEEDEESLYNANVMIGRTWKEQKTAFAYAMWIMAGGDTE